MLPEDSTVPAAWPYSQAGSFHPRSSVGRWDHASTLLQTQQVRLMSCSSGETGRAETFALWMVMNQLQLTQRGQENIYKWLLSSFTNKHFFHCWTVYKYCRNKTAFQSRIWSTLRYRPQVSTVCLEGPSDRLITWETMQDVLGGYFSQIQQNCS